MDVREREEGRLYEYWKLDQSMTVVEMYLLCDDSIPWY